LSGVGNRYAEGRGYLRKKLDELAWGINVI
jgi:hypothetical protein